MDPVVAEREIPIIHLFWPDRTVHQEGLEKMLNFVEESDLKDDQAVPYYEMIRKPGLDFGEIIIPSDRCYMLRMRLMSVGSLRALAFLPVDYEKDA